VWAKPEKWENEGTAVFRLPKGTINPKTLDLGEGVPPLTKGDFSSCLTTCEGTQQKAFPFDRHPQQLSA
jgi:hypothetical protein